MVVLDHGIRDDVLNLLPAQAVEVDMYADNPGFWPYHCHVHSHRVNGMITHYTILGNQTVGNNTGATRTYYIAAEEVLWNYAPGECRCVAASYAGSSDC